MGVKMINSNRLVEEFKKLVSIDSPSLGERQMGDYVKGKLRKLGIVATEDNSGQAIGGNCGNIYAKLDGNSTNRVPLLFCVHMDTVEPAKGKRAVVNEQGIIISMGETVLGADDLAGVAAILEALEVIKENNLEHRPIELLFTVAEEIYCKGSGVYDYSSIESKEAYVLDLTGAVGRAAYKAPTFLSFTIQVTGKSAHAGFASEEGIHAIKVAAQAISHLQFGRVEEDTTVNIGIINGGLATNIVPEYCILKGEIRSYSTAKSIEQMDIIKAKFQEAADSYGAKVEISTLRECGVFETSLDHPVIKRYENACKKVGVPVILEGTFGGSDLNHIACHGVTGIVIASGMNQVHSCQEYTTVEDLNKVAGITLSLMTSND